MYPNIFRYGSKELSQDAVFCWLIEWAGTAHADQNSQLHSLARSLISTMFEKSGSKVKSWASDIPIYQQKAGIDILAQINPKQVLLIEDKTNTREHSNQLSRYMSAAKKEFPGAEIVPIYLKTGDQSDFDRVNAAGFTVFLRHEILDVLQPSRVDACKSEILRQFQYYLSEWDDRVSGFVQIPVQDWMHDQWKGFFLLLQPKFEDFNWDKVPNASGGFMGAWWGGWEYPDHDIYHQIEENTLCFKVSLRDKKVSAERLRSLRSLWNNALVQAAANDGNASVTKPTRYGLGNTMTVAVYHDWLKTSADGLIQLDATLERLAHAEAILDAADPEWDE